MSDISKGLIYAENSQQCDLCGEIAELRPYGPNGEAICHPCGMKDIETTKRKFNEMMGDVVLPLELPPPVGNSPWEG